MKNKYGIVLALPLPVDVPKTLSVKVGSDDPTTRSIDRNMDFSEEMIFRSGDHVRGELNGVSFEFVVDDKEIPHTVGQLMPAGKVHILSKRLIQ